MSTNNENKLVPRLRFPEFIKDRNWYKRKMGEIGEFTGGGTPSRDNEDFWKGEIPWVSSSDIDEESIFSVNISRFISEEALKISATKLIPANSILLVSRVGVGKLAITHKPICTSQDFTNFTPINDDLIFLAYFLKNLKETLLGFSQGMAIKGFTKDDVSNLKILLPSLKEQQKIATCLSSLDEVITAEREKLELYKTHKKGLLQNLFPLSESGFARLEDEGMSEADSKKILKSKNPENQDSDKVPKLRFKEFESSGEWEGKSLQELFEIGNGRDYKHLSSGNIPVFGSGGYMVSVDDYLYEGESVCIGRKGTIDKPMFLTGKFWTVDTLFYTHSFKDSLPKFIFYVFQNIDWRKHNEAGGVPSLSKTNIYKIEKLIPGLKEQKRIADCLSSIDELINIQSQKVDALELHKKGLLQGLFPTKNNKE